MNTKEFLEKHPKPWRPAVDLASALTVEYLESKDTVIDGNGRSIDSRNLLEYLEEIEGERHSCALELQRRILADCQAKTKPVEEMFGTMPNIKALSNCSFRCQSTEIKVNQLGKATCNRCGRYRTYYDKKV